LHDNAPAHKAASVCQFLPKKITTLYLPPPPILSDLSPPEYFLSPKLKMKLKGLHFADIAEIQEVVTDELKNVKKKEFSVAFSETVRPCKSLYICQQSLF